MKFALIGAAGYIAPRHMEAIHAVGGDLVAAYDPSDSVGVLDQHFEDCEFFTEFERFDRHIAKLQRTAPIDYVVICSPNYLHDTHCRWALRSGADAICEKPLVIEPHNLVGLTQIEAETHRRVWAILQMRLHGEIVEAKEKYGNLTGVDVSVEYVTPRGRWYGRSWKGDQQKSGGLLMNIGVHLFDALGDIFGRLVAVHDVRQTEMRSDGVLELERAKVWFMLSVDRADLPPGKTAHRSITINGETFDISRGFTSLHERSYEEILSGRGFGVADASRGIEVVSALRRHGLRRAA